MEETTVLGFVAATLRAARPQPVPDIRLFENVFMPRYWGWRGLFLSVCFHLFVIFVLVPVSYMLPESEEEAWRRHARTFQPLHLQIPDRLYIASNDPAPAKPKAEDPPAKKPMRKPVEVAKADATPSSTPEKEVLRVPPKQFRLPPVLRKPFADQTLIQPDLPPDMALARQAKLPELYLSAPVLPRPTPKKFVEPGPSAPPDITPRNLDAPPQLAQPVVAPQDLQVATMLTGPDEALLRLPRPTAQFKTFQPPSGDVRASGRGASITPTLGEPVNILAYSANPATLSEKVTIPLGNQIGRLPGPPPSTDPAAPLGIPVAGAGTAGPLGVGISGGRGDGPGGDGSGSQTGVGDGTGSGGSGAAGSEGRGDGLRIANASSKPSIKYTTPIRIEHPSSGVFDVVVVQSSTDSSFPESAGALSGRPVYTVYVQAGAPRAWLMQYCIPKGVENGPKVVSGTVYIGKPVPVKAPYPLVTVLPPVTMQPRASYIMVHGFLDKAGQFKDLTVLRAPDERIGPILISQLSAWHFRPATRDGVPILVEVLLAIPPHEG